MIKFTMPLLLSNLLQLLYNMVDMIIVGHFVGKTGLSAVTIGGDVTTLLTFFVMGFANAGQIIIAQHIGANRSDRLGKIIGNLFTVLFSTAIVLSIVCFQFRTSILVWMNTPAEAWNYTCDYVTVTVLGLVFIYGYNVLSAVLRGMGDSRHPFIFISIAAVLNLVLDLVFVIGFNMAAMGAALATVIGQGVSFVACLIFIFRNKKQLGIDIQPECLKPESEIVLMLVRLGLPMAIKSAAVSFSKLFVDSWINSYGVVASSASGIESKINQMASLFSNAINAAASTMIGQNIGAEVYDRVKKIMKTAFLFAFSIDGALAIILLLFPRLVFGIFSADGEVIAACMTMIPMILLLFAANCARCPFNGLVNGSGNYKLNFLVAMLDGIVFRIGLSLLFGLGLGLGWLGFLYGDAIAGFTPFAIGSVYLKSGKWRTRKYVIK